MYIKVALQDLYETLTACNVLHPNSHCDWMHSSTSVYDNLTSMGASNSMILRPAVHVFNFIHLRVKKFTTILKADTQKILVPKINLNSPFN